MRNRRFPNYPDDTDYTTNAPSYYDDLARKEKLIRLLAERIWGYEKILDETLEEIQERFRAWEKNLEDFPEDVKTLLQQWLDDGTLDHIINDTIFNWKLDTSIFEQFRDSVTAQLQQTETQVDDIGVNIRKYGAISDGTFHSIRDTLPNYAELDLTSIHPDATPDNSVDWYAISQAYKENSVVRLAGHSVIDLPLALNINDRTLISEQGESKIENIGNGDAIVVGQEGKETYSLILNGVRVTGDRQKNRYGLYLKGAVNLIVENCYFNDHNTGVYGGTGDNVWGATFKNCFMQFNKKNGVKLTHYYNAQKNAITFDNCLLNFNGFNSEGVRLYDAGITTEDFGHGIDISGTGISIVNSDIEGNSGAGVRVGGEHTQNTMAGVNITGNYFEPNRLADIFIDNNSFHVFSGDISGNFIGSDSIAGAKLGGIFVRNYSNISGSSSIGNNSKFYNTDKDTFSMNSERVFNSVKMQEIFSKPIIFNRGNYEIQVEYEFNKVTPNFAGFIGMRTLDYDGQPISKDTTPEYVETPYARLINKVHETDTTLYFDDLIGFDVDYTWLVIYDVILSNGKVIGRDYATTTIYESGIQSINLSNNTITLSKPIGKVINNGTQVSLNRASGSSFVLGGYLSITDDTKTLRRKLIDTTNLSYAKHIYYLEPYVFVNNANNQNDQLKLKSFTYDKTFKPFESDTTSLSLLNNWAGDITANKNIMGQVVLEGYITNGTRTNNTVIATLPNEYRPSMDKPFVVRSRVTDTSHLGFLVLENGNIVISKPASDGNIGQSIAFNTIFQARDW